jgi:hypothetical protein
MRNEQRGRGFERTGIKRKEKGRKREGKGKL